MLAAGAVPGSGEGPPRAHQRRREAGQCLLLLASIAALVVSCEGGAASLTAYHASCRPLPSESVGVVQVVQDEADPGLVAFGSGLPAGITIPLACPCLSIAAHTRLTPLAALGGRAPPRSRLHPSTHSGE